MDGGSREYTEAIIGKDVPASLLNAILKRTGLK